MKIVYFALRWNYFTLFYRFFFCFFIFKLVDVFIYLLIYFIYCSYIYCNFFLEIDFVIEFPRTVSCVLRILVKFSEFSQSFQFHMKVFLYISLFFSYIYLIIYNLQVIFWILLVLFLYFYSLPKSFLLLN